MNGYLYFRINHNFKLDRSIEKIDKEMFALSNLNDQLDQFRKTIDDYSQNNQDAVYREPFFRLRDMILNTFIQLKDNLQDNDRYLIVIHQQYLLPEYERFVKTTDMANAIFSEQTTSNTLANNNETLIAVNIQTIRDSIDRILSYYEKKKSEELINRIESTSNLANYLLYLTLAFFVLGFGSMFIFFSRILLKPIENLVKATQHVAQGDLSQQLTVRTHDELGALETWFNVMTDNLKKSQMLLIAKNRRLEAVINNPNIGMILGHKSTPAECLNDWTRERFPICDTNTFLTLQNNGSRISAISKIIDEQLQHYLFMIKNQERTYECYGNCIDDDSALIIITDITEKLTLENQVQAYMEDLELRVHERTAELNKTYSELADNHDKLKALDQLKDYFLQNMSHEIRTPLTSVIGYLDVVLGYPDVKPIQRNFLTIALENAISLLQIINDLLDLSKIETGQMKLDKHLYNIKNIVEEAVTEISIQAKNKGLKLSVVLNNGKDNSDNVEMWGCFVDRLKIKQILNNLLSNAIKFSQKGGIRVVLEAKDTEVSIEVHDSGIGIQKDDLDIIFDKFRQVDSSISRNFEGTGLGLPIVKRLTELHGGKVTVESTFGKGSSFTITFPKV